MNVRRNVVLDGIPIVWNTNLSDEDVVEFYKLYGEQIAAPACHDATPSGGITIPIRIALLPFGEGLCLWSALGRKHTVLYRSSWDWGLWEARQREIEELRLEQAAEENAEKELVMTEDTHLGEMCRSAMRLGNYDVAAACLTSRAELHDSFKHFRAMPARWTHWDPDLIFARFPKSKYGIEFLKRFRPLSQSFCNFAHWFSVRSGLKGEALVEETRAIYSEGMRMFPESGSLAHAASLFFRRVGRFEMAKAICVDAIRRGLQDRTKSGFEGRLQRLERESQNRQR